MEVFEKYLNKDVLNIFCDASVRPGGNKTYDACAGSVAINESKILAEDFRIISKGTSVKGEINAVKQGIFLAYYVYAKNKYKFKTINLFSDSQLSIYGIRDRILNWDCKDGKLYGYSKDPIMYFEDFLEMINFIVDKDFKINFYHQKGHVNMSNTGSVQYATKTFEASNCMRRQIPYDFVRYISSWNDYVDKKSRSILYKFDVVQNKVIQPIRFVPNNEYFNTLQKYEQIQGGKLNGKL